MFVWDVFNFHYFNERIWEKAKKYQLQHYLANSNLRQQHIACANPFYTLTKLSMITLL